MSNHTKVGISNTYSRAYKETYLPGVETFFIKIVLHCLPVYIVSDEKFAAIFIFVPLYVSIFFEPLPAFIKTPQVILLNAYWYKK